MSSMSHVGLRSLAAPATAVWLACLHLTACGSRADLSPVSEACTPAQPCLLGEGSAWHTDFELSGPEGVSAVVRSADESVIRPYNLREDSVHFAAEGVGRTSVELGVAQGGGQPTVLHFEVAEVADLGLVVTASAPLVANESYGFDIAPVDGTGRSLSFNVPLVKMLTCGDGSCRVSLAEGRHSLWNGSKASPVAVQAVRADRIHGSVDGHTLTYGLAVGEQRLQVPDHPSLLVESTSGHCRLEEESVVGASWVMQVVPLRKGVPCTLRIAPTMSDRYEGVGAVTVGVDP